MHAKTSTLAVMLIDEKATTRDRMRSKLAVWQSQLTASRRQLTAVLLLLCGLKLGGKTHDFLSRSMEMRQILA